MWTLDAFADYPVGPGCLTLEAAYINLDLDGAGPLSATGTPAKNSEGDGFYFQAGYFFQNMDPAWLNNFQPWFDFETWDSDGAGDRGRFDNFRIGLSYFLKGHNANIKIGYEVFDADRDFTGTSEDSIETFVSGVYVTY